MECNQLKLRVNWCEMPSCRNECNSRLRQQPCRCLFFGHAKNKRRVARFPLARGLLLTDPTFDGAGHVYIPAGCRRRPSKRECVQVAELIPCFQRQLGGGWNSIYVRLVLLLYHEPEEYSCIFGSATPLRTCLFSTQTRL
jgi:hypothetical protein